MRGKGYKYLDMRFVVILAIFLIRFIIMFILFLWQIGDVTHDLFSIHRLLISLFTDHLKNVQDKLQVDLGNA